MLLQSQKLVEAGWVSSFRAVLTLVCMALTRAGHAGREYGT